MKRVIIGIFMLVILAGNLNAQSMSTGLMDNFRFTRITEGTYSKYNLKLSEIQGSPYLDAKFNPGKITTNNGAVYTDIPLRYNGYTDDLEFKKGEDTYNLDPKTIVKKAEFGGRTFGCLSYSENGKIKNGFFEILTEGKAILAVRYTVKFLEREEIKAFAEPKPARFDEAQKDFFLTIDNAPARTVSNKKSLLEMFGDKKGEIETYISKNKINVRGEDAFIKIVAYYNSL